MIRPASKSPALAFVLLATVIFSAWLTLLLMTSVDNRVAAAGMTRPIGQVGPDNFSHVRANSEPGEGTPVSVTQIPTVTPISLNQQLFGEITPTFEIDWFVFGGNQGAHYEVRLSESPPETFYSLALTLCMPNEQGQFICGDEQITPASGEVSIEWTVDFDVADPIYYFRVRAPASSAVPVPYQIVVTLRGTTPPPEDWDNCEINDTLTGAWSRTMPPGGPCPISVGQLISDLNFVPYAGQPSPNPDYFQVWLKAGYRYRMETYVTVGVDTEMFLYAPGATYDSLPIAVNDDSGEGFGSRIEWDPSSDGTYIVMVINIIPLPPVAWETYELSVTGIPLFRAFLPSVVKTQSLR